MDNTLHLVGIAKKARRVEVGEEPVGAAARARQARLIVLARDAADNTCRRAAILPRPAHVPWSSAPTPRRSWAGPWGARPAPCWLLPTRGWPLPLWESSPPGTRSGTARRAEAVSAKRGQTAPAPSGAARTSRSCKRPGQSPGLLPPPAARSAVWPSGAGAHRARAGRRTRSPGSRAEIPLGRRPAMAGAVEDICHRASAEPRLCGERRGGEAARPVPRPREGGRQVT